MMMTEGGEEKMEFTKDTMACFEEDIEPTFSLAGGIFDLPDHFDSGDRGSFAFFDLFYVDDPPQFVTDAPPVSSAFASAPRESSENVNFSATANSSSFSSSSSEACHDPDSTPSASDLPETKGCETEQDQAKKMESDLKEQKKKKQKGQMRLPRFAFLTKSEVDHLEDGFRWRKYGQKAVKHSPFARSYYRCTTSLCTVKKRVERSSNDPTVVITTYEGQHTHPNPVMPRGTHHFSPPSPPNDLRLFQLQNTHLFSSQQFDFHPVKTGAPPQPPPPPPHYAVRLSRPSYSDAGMEIGPRDLGLLQDLIPSKLMKREQ